MSFDRIDLEYERYEVFVKSDLFAERRMVGSCQTLGEAKARAASIGLPHGEHAFFSIDYIGLYKTGRDEKHWVQMLSDSVSSFGSFKKGEWREL